MGWGLARGLPHMGRLERAPGRGEPPESAMAYESTRAGVGRSDESRPTGRYFLIAFAAIATALIPAISAWALMSLRAQAIADELACALEFPGAEEQPARAEHGLRLALELRDSEITYRSRYLSVLQPAAALDVMLADDGNPRGLAYQLSAARRTLTSISAASDRSLVALVDGLLEDVQAMVRGVSAAADQPHAVRALPERLRRLRDGVAELSDRLSRRYFALLPTARAVGISGDGQPVRGAA